MKVLGDEENVDQGETAAPESGDLRLENVSFGYGEKEVIRGVSAVIPKGKITAIVGLNGSGKTTLTRLIERLYPGYSGKLSGLQGLHMYRRWRSL